jgi:hypothetical protein
MLRRLHRNGCVNGSEPSEHRTLRRLVARGLVEHWGDYYHGSNHRIIVPRESAQPEGDEPSYDYDFQDGRVAYHIHGFYMLTQAGRDMIPEGGLSAASGP